MNSGAEVHTLYSTLGSEQEVDGMSVLPGEALFATNGSMCPLQYAVMAADSCGIELSEEDIQKYTRHLRVVAYTKNVLRTKSERGYVFVPILPIPLVELMMDTSQIIGAGIASTECAVELGMLHERMCARGEEAYWLFVGTNVTFSSYQAVYSPSDIRALIGRGYADSDARLPTPHELISALLVLECAREQRYLGAGANRREMAITGCRHDGHTAVVSALHTGYRVRFAADREAKSLCGCIQVIG